jgi:predicted Zn-dependent protease
MWEMGVSAYQETIQSHRLITSGSDYEMVQRVGQRIAAACGHPEYQWEFTLIDDPATANAFCLPGGKVAVYTGILPITQTEDGLAVVVGHEVAHATAEHGNERMTHEMIASGLMTAADLAMQGWGDMDGSERAGWMAALGMGAEVGVLLPYSRTHESEADEIGLRYLVRAGYDPWAAPALWERMAAAAGANRSPELMSTHPDPANRAARLRELIPKIVAEEQRS